MTRTIALVLALLVCPVVLIAQTPVTRGPVTTTNKFAWNAPPGISLTDHPTFEIRVKDSFSPTVVTVLLNPTCALANNIISCTRQLTQQNVDALNMVGVHNLTMTYFRTDVGEGAASVPFVLTSPTGAPTSFGIIQ